MPGRADGSVRGVTYGTTDLDHESSRPASLRTGAQSSTKSPRGIRVNPAESETKEPTDRLTHRRVNYWTTGPIPFWVPKLKLKLKDSSRLVSHYRQLSYGWGVYATAGGAPHLRFPVRIIGALALQNHLVAEDHKDRTAL